jgi:hypothetical protein
MNADLVAAVRVGSSYAGKMRSRLMIQRGLRLRAVRWWVPRDLGLVLRALLIDGFYPRTQQ